MVAPAETTYARSGDVHIAYQVVGDGPFDLVFSPSPVSNLDVAWEWPPFARFLRRLASFSRLILFDKRGTGLSDRVTDAATLEERMDDLRAVMDAVGSSRAAIFGTSEGGPLALLFAATYPERVSSLVLYGSYAKAINSDDYDCGTDADIHELGMQLMEQEWGNCALIEVFSPSVRDDEAFRSWNARYERQSASPSAAVAIQRLNAKLDVRPVLSAVKVQTLILYRAGEYVAHVEGSRYLAAHIDGARYVELDGVDYHPYVGDQDAILDPIEEFLTGAPRVRSVSRGLATLLVTDDAVALAASFVPTVLRYDGRVATTEGGAVAATFDGPARAVACARTLVGTSDARVGLHIGEVETRDEMVTGAAVAVGTSVRDHAAPGQVLISRTLADLLAGSGFGLASEGVHDLADVGAWELFAVTASDAPSSSRAVDAARGTFRHEGDVWLLGFAGRDVRVRDTKGLRDIATLLARPSREVHVAELVGATELGASPTAQPVVDRTAITAYRARLTELEDDEQEAVTNHNDERAARARAERDAIVAEISAAVGIGGKPRLADDWTERARKAVRLRMANALKRIEAEHAALGRHLRASIRTGTYCAYEPVEPVIWQR
jgi:pimeloyl-ACP methyl ester carboxylesterase